MVASGATVVNVGSFKIRRFNSSSLPSESILVDDINVKISNKIGDKVEGETFCDIRCMLSVMDCVGTTICVAYHRIMITQKCYLVIANTGGHGTNDTITAYTSTLNVQFNIRVIFQLPYSLYTNVLDLALWIFLQTAIEIQYYLKRCNANAIINSIMKTSAEDHLEHYISKVCIFLKPVLCNIFEAKGENDLVEKKKGKKFQNIKVEIVLQMEKETLNEMKTY